MNRSNEACDHSEATMPGFKGNTMTRINPVGIAALVLLLLLGSPLQAQQEDGADSAEPASQEAPIRSVMNDEPDIEELEKMSLEAYEAENWVRYYGANIRMMNQRPYEPIYMKRVIEACALLERRRTAYHYMLRMQQQGLSYDFSEVPDAANIKTTELFEYLNDLMIEAGEPAGVAEPVTVIEDKYGVPSALTWDQSRERFLVGTLADGAILSLEPDGSLKVLITADVDNGLWAIRGMHADTENNRLWVTTSAIPEFSDYTPADRGRAALLEFDLTTLKQVNRFNTPMDNLLHDLGAVAVADSGDVYTIDQLASIVYRKSAGGQALEQFAGSEDLDALSGLAVSQDNRRLYIADRYKGVLVIDPIDQTSTMLTGPETLNLGRIDSLTLGQKKLFIVQNDMQPERLMQLDLDDMGSDVSEALPMASALENFAHPGLSLYKGGYVYYFANLAKEGDAPYEFVRTALVTAEGKPEFQLDKNPEPDAGD
jgi:sugar lactone lactonase YvrE